MNPSAATSEIERALGVVAYIVVRHGDAYMPILDRLERELEAEKTRGGNRERAQRILASLTKVVRDVPAA